MFGEELQKFWELLFELLDIHVQSSCRTLRIRGKVEQYRLIRKT